MKKIVVLLFLALVGCVNLTVVGQNPEGTLVMDPAFTVYLIEANSIDKKLYDGDHIWEPRSNFENAGTYRYINVMGSMSTVRKLRRVK